MRLLFKLAFLLYLVYSTIGCIKVPQPCSKNYAFGFPISVTSQDTFTVGDTIWWAMDIPNQLFDTTSGEYIDLTDFELFFWFGIAKLEHNSVVSSQTHLFNFTAELGGIEQDIDVFNSAHFLMQSTNDKRFKVGCIPTKAGAYDAEIGFPNLYGTGEGLRGEELQVVDPNCKEFITRKSKITINNGEINYHMMEGVCRFLSNGNQHCYGPESELHTYSVYAFHVKEP